MSIKTKPFPSWREFKAEFDAFLPLRTKGAEPRFSEYIFRGQMDSKFELVSSFDRIVPAKLTDRSAEFERWHKFFKYLRRHIGNSVDHLDNDESMSLAQHYGVSTRLLDWTYSPYIAAFFAFFDSLRLQRDEISDVAVCAIHVASFKKATEGQFQVIETRGRENIRVRNQLGKFIVNKSNFRSLDQYVEKSSPEAGKSMVKFTIPSSERVAALNDLLLMGISPVDIYPDNEGIAMYVRLRQALDGYSF
jgi:hypothetical protein